MISPSVELVTLREGSMDEIEEKVVITLKKLATETVGDNVKLHRVSRLMRQYDTARKSMDALDATCHEALYGEN